MVTTNEEQRAQAVEARAIGERMAAVEAQQKLLIEVVRENGRRCDENYLAIVAKGVPKSNAFVAESYDKHCEIDITSDESHKTLITKIDRLTYLTLGVGALVVISVVMELVL